MEDEDYVVQCLASLSSFSILEAVWDVASYIRSELCGTSMEELAIFEDYQSAIQITENPQFHG